ncbi:MAG: hypothetical protein HZB75_01610 [Candidatus Saccharibacteria bacterium]|nr:MAG: hypothetical protein HZB75_01610 [Candidatus Saccharibacteria bacterium]
MRYLKTDKLYCFSPPIMIATFFIEIICAIYVLFKYKVAPIPRLAVMILVGLAAFQLAEYNVCEGAWGMDSLMWARIGYVAITLLPPLGFHLATKLAGEKRPVLVGAAYASAAVFAFIFLFVGHGMQSQACLGNYVIFTIAPWATALYSMYYYGWLMVGVGYAWKAGKTVAANKRQALQALAIGYLAFIVPTTIANVIDSSTIAGIPSIMCGFAVIWAIILTTVVLPNYYKPEDSAK